MRVMLCDLPETIKGMTVKTFDGDECYTIVLNSRLSCEQQRITYEHEVKHLEEKDFDRVGWLVDEIEMIRHK